MSDRMPDPRRPLLGLACLILFVAAPARAEPPLRPLLPRAGAARPAALAGVEADGAPLFRDAERTARLGLEQFVVWGHPAEAGAAAGGVAQVVTAGGSLLIGELLRVTPDEVLLDADLAGNARPPAKLASLDRAPLLLPTGQVRGAILQPPADPLARDRLLARLAAAAEKSDLLLLENGDELAGRLLGIEEAARLETDVGPVEVPLARVAAVILDASRGTAPPTKKHLRVGLSDGTRLRTSGLRAVAGGLLAALPCGAELRIVGGADAIVWLQPIGHGVDYLSDLEPISYRHEPYLDLPWPYHRDRNVRGGQLRAGGRLYERGLGMHSAARLTWRLERPCQRLEADVAIDDVAGNRGSVIFRVFTTKGDSWNQAYTSPVVRGGDKPLPISVDLTAARAVTLMVDFADRGDELDHANWLNARLVMAEEGGAKRRADSGQRTGKARRVGTAHQEKRTADKGQE